MLQPHFYQASPLPNPHRAQQHRAVLHLLTPPINSTCPCTFLCAARNAVPQALPNASQSPAHIPVVLLCAGGAAPWRSCPRTPPIAAALCPRNRQLSSGCRPAWWGRAHTPSPGYFEYSSALKDPPAARHPFLHLPCTCDPASCLLFHTTGSSASQLLYLPSAHPRTAPQACPPTCAPPPRLVHPMVLLQEPCPLFPAWRVPAVLRYRPTWTRF